MTELRKQIAYINHLQEPTIDKLYQSAVRRASDMEEKLSGSRITDLPADTCSGNQHRHRLKVEHKRSSIQWAAIHPTVLTDSVRGKVFTEKRLLQVKPMKGGMIAGNILRKAVHALSQLEQFFGFGFGNLNHDTKHHGQTNPCLIPNPATYGK